MSRDRPTCHDSRVQRRMACICATGREQDKTICVLKLACLRAHLHLVSLAGEPKQSRWRQTLEKGKDVFRGVGIVFRTGSFLIILVGNIISVIIGLGLGYKIMYLQVCAHPSWTCRAQ